MTTATKTHVSITGPCAWHGADLAGDPRWRFALSGGDIAELQAALALVRRQGLPWERMSKADFPLAGLAGKLAEMAVELEDGSGLANLSGLPVEAFGDGLRHVWYGIGLHLGQAVYQDCNGLLMRDIRNESQDTDAVLGHRLTARDGSTFKSSKARTLSNALLRFHTDRCDVVGLLCVRPAPVGGVSRIASSAAVHNMMLQRRPDLAALLYGPYYRARLGEEQGGDF